MDNKRSIHIKTISVNLTKRPASALKKNLALPVKKEPRKKNITNKKAVGAVLLAMLIILIFLSKTIYTYNLPVVTAVSPQSGKLSKLELTTGVVAWAEVESVYIPLGGMIEELLVQEGDAVAKGQPLARLTFNTEDAERKLEELAISRKKLNLDMQNINLRLEKLNRTISALESETYWPDASSDYEINVTKNDIAKAMNDYELLREKFNNGEASEREVNNAWYALQNLYLKLDNLEKTRAENEIKAIEEYEKKEQSRQKQLLDYQADKDALNLELKGKRQDLENLEIQEEQYNKTLEESETKAVIYASEDSTVLTLPVNKGQTVNTAQLFATLGIGYQYKIECDISLENNFVAVGDTCKMQNATHTFDGVVESITPAENKKEVEISIASTEIAAGETFEIKLEKKSAVSYTLVPNGAVNKDSDGYFLYQIKRRDGILGKEFYAEKLRVYIGDSDAENTAIVQGVSFFEPIVLLSDKPFSEKETIKIANVGDFFEE